MKAANLKTYPDAVADILKSKGQADKAAEWMKKAMHLGHPEAKALAKKDYGVEIFWCMEAPRAREGYYRIKVEKFLGTWKQIRKADGKPFLILPCFHPDFFESFFLLDAQGGVECCVHRSWAFAPYADLIWMECAMANVEEAREFAHGVHSKFPNQMLAYNCSPSFNWDASGLRNVLLDNSCLLFPVCCCADSKTIFLVSLPRDERQGNRELPERDWKNGVRVALHHAGRLPLGQFDGHSVRPRLPEAVHAGLRGDDPASRATGEGRDSDPPKVRSVRICEIFTR